MEESLVHWAKYREYKRVSVLGHGQQGTAVLLKDPASEDVAVAKEIELSRLTREDLNSLINEVAMLRSFNHENVISYYGYFYHADHLCIVMEFAPSGTLANAIERHVREERRFDTAQVAFWLSQLGNALQYVHSKSILHRDLSTANVFLSSSGDIKLGDFGIARAFDKETLAQTVCGTPYYLSPELVSGKPYGAPSDCWALGVILFEMLTLSRPFTASSLGGLVIAITQVQFQKQLLRSCGHPAEMQAIVVELLCADPAQRLTTTALLARPELARATRPDKALTPDLGLVRRGLPQPLPSPGGGGGSPGGNPAGEIKIGERWSLPSELSTPGSNEATKNRHQSPRSTRPHPARYYQGQPAGGAGSGKGGFGSGGWMEAPPSPTCCSFVRRHRRLWCCFSCCLVFLGFMGVNALVLWAQLKAPTLGLEKIIFQRVQIGPHLDISGDHVPGLINDTLSIINSTDSLSESAAALWPRLLLGRFLVEFSWVASITNENDLFGCLVGFVTGGWWGSKVVEAVDLLRFSLNDQQDLTSAEAQRARVGGVAGGMVQNVYIKPGGTNYLSFTSSTQDLLSGPAGLGATQALLLNEPLQLTIAMLLQVDLMGIVFFDVYGFCDVSMQLCPKEACYNVSGRDCLGKLSETGCLDRLQDGLSAQLPPEPPQCAFHAEGWNLVFPQASRLLSWNATSGDAERAMSDEDKKELVSKAQARWRRRNPMTDDGAEGPQTPHRQKLQGARALSVEQSESSRNDDGVIGYGSFVSLW